jgi:Ssp1 endopeptidase immunity protein Rap1a
MHNALNAILSKPKDNTYRLPDNASVSQLAKVVTKYGHDHPEELNQSALLIVNNAFTRAFPCK